MRLLRFFRVSLIVLAGIFAMSCSHITQPSPDEVMEKINSGETLEEADYETILDYLEEFCDVGEMSDNDYESGREVGEQYPYFLTFAMATDKAPQEIKEQERFSEVTGRFIRLMNR